MPTSAQSYLTEWGHSHLGSIVLNRVGPLPLRLNRTQPSGPIPLRLNRTQPSGPIPLRLGERTLRSDWRFGCTCTDSTSARRAGRLRRQSVVYRGIARGLARISTLGGGGTCRVVALFRVTSHGARATRVGVRVSAAQGPCALCGGIAEVTDSHRRASKERPSIRRRNCHAESIQHAKSQRTSFNRCAGGPHATRSITT